MSPPSDRDELESNKEDCSIFIVLSPKRKPKIIKILNGEPCDPFKNKPDAPTDLICVPVATGVVSKDDTVTILETMWKVNRLYLNDTKMFLEVEKDDKLFKSTVTLNYVQKQVETFANKTPPICLYEEYSVLYWAYSNLKHLLMHAFNDKCSVNKIRRDLVPYTTVTSLPFGIEGPVTFRIKEEGLFSTATWGHVLVDQ